MNRPVVPTVAIALGLLVASGTVACGGRESDRRTLPAPSNAATSPATPVTPAATNDAPAATPAAEKQPGGDANPLEAHRQKDAEGRVPTVNPDELQSRLASKQRTHVIEVKSSEGFPAIEGAEVVRPDVLDAWAGRLPKSAYIVAYCT